MTAEPAPSPVVVLSDFERRPQTWTRDGARTAVRADGRVRVILQVLACRIEWRDANGSWHPMKSSYATRERLGHLLEAWLESRISAP
jgi:hypothetical protein